MDWAMSKIKIICVVGARPNFMKIAPIMRVLRNNILFDSKLVHTGQHYDQNLSKIFFEDLAIPRPDIELEVGSGSQAQQTAEIMKRFEEVLELEQPHAVLVVGDVTSTIACALATSKFQLKEHFQCNLGDRRRPVLIHVEAGLRSGDRDMPEEINRILTDAISDILFVTEASGIHNLNNVEGVAVNRCFLVGNVMIDTLLAAKEQAMRSNILNDLNLTERHYALLTLHRPSNVDDFEGLIDLLKTMDEIAQDIPVLFPVHPRTLSKIEQHNISFDPTCWRITGPMGYLDFIRAMSSAKVVLTDSGGIQEETTVLGVPCITLRDNTERLITVTEGTNIIAGTNHDSIIEAYETTKTKEYKPSDIYLWDGKSAERINNTLTNIFNVDQYVNL